MTRARTKLLALGIALASAAACTAGQLDGGGLAPAEGSEAEAQGQALYDSLCASCHGSQGEGHSAPALRDWARPPEELVRITEQRMPLGSPERCDLACARTVAAYILARFKGDVACNGEAVAPRRLRLLTKREYEATVRDLFGGGAPSGGAPARCEEASFRFDAGARSLRSVHVAGSFNGWAGTVSGGGWPLTKDAQGNTWALTRAVPAGKHSYKFVLDDRDWVADSTSPQTEPDGHGGVNSVLHVAACGGGTTPSTLPFSTAGFPADTRPEGFPFDNHAGARLVTSVHAEEYLKAARAVGAFVAKDAARILGCAPSDAACGPSFLRRMGRRVLRRPLESGEIARFEGMLRSASTAEEGITAAMAALLVSPSFLYRTELGEPQGDGTFRLTGYEVASLLSYSLWGTLPDDALLDAAERGDLGRPEGITREARRLLDDRRARAHLGTFALQWLGAEGVATAPKNEGMYPSFTPSLRTAVLEESRAFFTHVVFEGKGTLAELLTANYTFANEELARLYGLPGVQGAALRKVPLDGRRAGILGHASVLAATSHSDQSSPIRRGLFVRRSLLCQDFPPPPANPGGIPKIDPNATTKERFRQHSANEACKSCHQYIDEVGFGFERFDAIGQYRETENGQPIDGVGDMNDVEALGRGTRAPFSSLPELASTLAASESARRCFVQTAQGYTLGDTALGANSCATRAGRFAASGGNIRELLLDVLSSPETLVRR